MFKQILFVLLFCLVPTNVFAKCGNAAIWIQGVISGATAGSTVSVQVVPDSDWNSKPATIDANGQFYLTVYFDRTEAGYWEKCSREPKTVTVQLHRNGQLVDQVPLQFSEDFVRKDGSDFVLRSQITLRSR